MTMRGWILAALALVGVGLVTYSFLKPGAAPVAGAPAVEQATAPMATPAEAHQPPSVVAAPPASAPAAQPAEEPRPSPQIAAESEARERALQQEQQRLRPSAQAPARSAAPSAAPPQAVILAAPPPPPAAPAPAATETAEAAPPSAATETAPAEPPAPPVAEAAAAEAPPAAASTGSASEDERIIECARTGAWGVAGCPTQEDLVARFSRAGSVAFTDPPREMNVGRSYTVRAAAALGETLAEETVRESAGAGARVQNRDVQLLPSLEAELTGVGFDIRPLQREGAQALLTGRANEWAWEVRPTEGGERQLTLIVWGQLTLDNARMAPIRVQTIHHTVTVAVDLQTRAALAIDWVAYHWEAGAGLGALGLAGFGWAAGRRRRKMAA